MKGLTRISKIFAFSAPFGKFSSILRRSPNSAKGWPILCKILRAQNRRIMTSLGIGKYRYSQNFSAKGRPGGAGPPNVNLGHALLSRKLLELES